MEGFEKGLRKLSAALLLVITLWSCPLLADDETTAFRKTNNLYTTPRFTLHIDDGRPVLTEKVELVKNIVDSSLAILDGTYEELSRIFMTKPQKKVILRFLSPEDFRKKTGAPSWTSAMYFRGEITIPVPVDGQTNFLDLKRAVRHEYVHAVISELSGQRCPAWLDEGVAQLLEGKINPLLGPALRKWVEDSDEAIPLNWLENGFTTLSNDMVPAAYAQSLFATRTIVNRLGFKAIRNYLRLLKHGVSESVAFRLAFKQRKSEFESQLALQMQRWADSNQKTP